MAEQRGFVLTDGVVGLRPWRLDDAPAVFAACQDPEIARFVPIPQPYTEADALAYVTTSARLWGEGKAAVFAIVDIATNRILGSMARHQPREHRVSFGYWLAPEARGRGAATRALRLLGEWTLATTDLVRLELYTDVGNDRSGAVALRAGFQREGIRRAWDLDRAGRPTDAVFYVRVRGNAARSHAPGGSLLIRALHDDALAGYVTVKWRSDYGPFAATGTPEIQDLNVLPRYRRRGVATSLLDGAERLIRGRSQAVGIGVGLFADYGAAQRLYVRRGYVPDGRGMASHGRYVAAGDHVRADDDLVVYLTKRLDDWQ